MPKLYILHVFCRKIKLFIRFRSAFVFGLQTLYLKDFSKIYQLKGLKPKSKGRTNFYECCDLTEKVYLKHSLKYIGTIHLKTETP